MMENNNEKYLMQMLAYNDYTAYCEAEEIKRMEAAKLRAWISYKETLERQLGLENPQD